MSGTADCFDRAEYRLRNENLQIDGIASDRSSAVRIFFGSGRRQATFQGANDLKPDVDAGESKNFRVNSGLCFQRVPRQWRDSLFDACCR